MGIIEEMTQKLEDAFAPEELEIIDESESHRGHAGYREGGESHFHVSIQSAAFSDMTRIERHRAIHNALGHEIISRIHALALTVKV